MIQKCLWVEGNFGKNVQKTFKTTSKQRCNLGRLLKNFSMNSNVMGKN
jgi:hypothetical protein